MDPKFGPGVVLFIFIFILLFFINLFYLFLFDFIIFDIFDLSFILEGRIILEGGGFSKGRG